MHGKIAAHRVQTAIYLDRSLLTQVDDLVKQLDDTAKTKQQGPGTVKVSRSDFIVRAIEEYLEHGEQGWNTLDIAEDIENEICIALADRSDRMYFGIALGKIRAYYRAGVITRTERDAYLAKLD